MDEYRISRRVLTELSGRRVRGRLSLGCMDGVTATLGSGGMTVEAAL